MRSSDLPPDSEAPRKPRRGRALLVAAMGVATITYGSLQAGCGGSGGDPPTSGNLLPPPETDASISDSGVADGGDTTDAMPISGNLLPPPEDGGVSDGSVSDTGEPTPRTP